MNKLRYLFTCLIVLLVAFFTIGMNVSAATGAAYAKSEELESNLVELADEDGNVTQCEIYDVVDFEGKTYVMLLPQEEGDEDPEIIVMEYIEEGEEGFFQNIDDEEEFDRVCEYIESLADEVEE